jgi:replication factor C subunit 3/5
MSEMDVEKEIPVQSSSSSSVAATLPWVEKYRPKELAELIAHEEIITILNKLIESNKLPHLLFHGPPGTGKTSTILACARKMYGDNFKSMVLELNASDDRGIDVVRDQIKEFAGTKKLFSSGVKLVILDEADAMTNDAQSALRRVVEKYTTNTRFCMICNYVNKIIPALQSRCTRFRFAPLRPEQIIGRLQDVVDAEHVEITEGGKTALLQLACGDLRRVLNLLQSAAMAYPQITEEAVYLTAGAAMPTVIEDTYQSLLNDDFDKAYKKILSVRAE